MMFINMLKVVEVYYFIKALKITFATQTNAD